MKFRDHTKACSNRGPPMTLAPSAELPIKLNGSTHKTNKDNRLSTASCHHKLWRMQSLLVGLKCLPRCGHRRATEGDSVSHDSIPEIGYRWILSPSCTLYYQAMTICGGLVTCNNAALGDCLKPALNLSAVQGVMKKGPPLNKQANLLLVST